MTVPHAGRKWFLRAWLVPVGVIAAAAASPAPAQADPLTDSFLAALNNAGVSYNDPSTAVSLGQSICPMLAQPGGTFASVASSMAGDNGMSPDMNGMFTSIAISMFCPAVMTSLANGDWVNALPLANALPIAGGLPIPGLGG